MILTTVLQLIALALLYFCLDMADSNAPVIRIVIIVCALISVTALLYHWENKRGKYDRDNHSD